MANYLTHSDLSLDNFSGTDPDQDAEQFINLMERRISFALGQPPAAPGVDFNAYNFRKKSLFSSPLRGPAADWYETNVVAATTWDQLRARFITRFEDGGNKFRHRMEIEHCLRRDGEEIKNYLHRIKLVVDKGWPDDSAGIATGDQPDERAAQARQRRQRCMDYSLRGMRPRHLQRKAHEFLMGHPNATWDDFSRHVIDKDLAYQVSATWLNDDEQNKKQMETMSKQLKDLTMTVKETSVNALAIASKPVDVNQKGRQNTTRFCGYCRSNGHTLNWCIKKMRDGEIKKVQNEMTAEKKMIFSEDYNKRKGPTHGSHCSTFTKEDQQHRNYAKQIDSAGADQCVPRFQSGSQSLSFPMNGPPNSDKSPSFSQKLDSNSNNLPFVSRENSYNQNNFHREQNVPNSQSPPSGPCWPDLNRSSRPQTPPKRTFRPAFGKTQSDSIFTPYERKFPLNNDGTRSNGVQFTTLDDSVNQISSALKHVNSPDGTFKIYTTNFKKKEY